jgi:hypothetical protein
LVGFEAHAEITEGVSDSGKKSKSATTRSGQTPLFKLDRQPSILLAQASTPRGRRVVLNKRKYPRGLAFNMQLGLSIPVGEGASNYSVGLRWGLSVGYELRFRFGTITPLLHFSYNTFSPASSFTVQVGARVDYYLARKGKAKWNLWGRSMIGYGQISNGGSEGGLATDHAVGASYHFNRYIGVGFFLEANYITVESTWFGDIGMFSFDMGLIVHGKLPI